MRQYYPYPANDGRHKYYIITKSGRKVLFGAAGYSDFTKHKDEDRKQRYISRHKIMKIGVNPELILPDFGLVGCYGINPQLTRVIGILKIDFYLNAPLFF